MKQKIITISALIWELNEYSGFCLCKPKFKSFIDKSISYEIKNKHSDNIITEGIELQYLK